MIFAFNNISFECNYQLLFHSLHGVLAPGEMLQISGPNGGGKSTLLRIFAGYLEPCEGSVTWQNESIFRQTDFYQQNICYIGHLHGMRLHLTAYENLVLLCALAHAEIKKSFLAEVLERVGLASVLDRQVRYFSAGQIRRLALARLLLKSRKLWILDEPLTALDAEGQLLLNQFVTLHLDAGGIALIATHQNFTIEKKIHKLKLQERQRVARQEYA